MKKYRRLLAVLICLILIPAKQVNADYVINWRDDATTNIDGYVADATMAEAHPFHYYAVYNWDYVKQGTAALQQLQQKYNVTASPESNFVYYMAMLRAVELGLDNRHSHLSPSHGNLFSKMNVGEVYTGGDHYTESIANWEASSSHLENILNVGKGSRAIAYGCSNGGAIGAYASFDNSNAQRITQAKHLVKGMEAYYDPLAPKYAWYRIQFDEADFTTMTLSGVSRFEDTYYQAANDDINHVISGWDPYFQDVNGKIYFSETEAKVGDSFTIVDRLYPMVCLDATSLSDLDNQMNINYNNCYVCLALDNFIVSSSNPEVMSVSGNTLTVKGGGDYLLTFTYKYNTNYSFQFGCEVILDSPDCTTTTQTIKAGLEVKTSEAEYVINTDKKTVTYEQPVSTASKSANIVIPDSIKINNKTYKVTSIAPRAYANNKAVQKITIGKNVTSIGKEAFKSCTSLQAVAGGSQVKTINQGAFYGCNRLTQVSFPGVTNVKEKAFASCKKLSSVVFGKQLTTIGKKVFDKDSALKNIYIKSTKVKKVDKTSLSGVPKSTKLYLPSSKKKTYSKLFQSAKVKKKYVKFK